MPTPLKILSWTHSLITVKTLPCIQCGKSGSMTIRRDGYDRWQKDTYIQDALPELTADDREQLMTGTHGECFEELFREEMFLEDGETNYDEP
jgi:hypothetical protein